MWLKHLFPYREVPSNEMGRATEDSILFCFVSLFWISTYSLIRWKCWENTREERSTKISIPNTIAHFREIQILWLHIGTAQTTFGPYSEPCSALEMTFSNPQLKVYQLIQEHCSKTEATASPDASDRNTHFQIPKVTNSSTSLSTRGWHISQPTEKLYQTQ